MLCYVILWNVTLCYVTLCYIMLCYIILCYVMLYYVMLCYVMLHYVILCYVMICCVMGAFGRPENLHLHSILTYFGQNYIIIALKGKVLWLTERTLYHFKMLLDGIVIEHIYHLSV
jgi:hypothetical protein